jgi:hypothetical protein
MPDISSTPSLGDRIAEARARHGLSSEPGPRPIGRGRPKKAQNAQMWWKQPKKLIPYAMVAGVVYLLVCGVIANVQWFLM